MTASKADIRYGGGRAFYNWDQDYIQLPLSSAFFEPINFHRTALHELGHWSGAKSRLNRDYGKRHGDQAYGREELVAELASAFVCATLGIQPTVRHADYIGAWLEIMRSDTRAIFQAASHASKAADYLLAFVKSDDDALQSDIEQIAA